MGMQLLTVPAHRLPQLLSQAVVQPLSLLDCPYSTARTCVIAWAHGKQGEPQSCSSQLHVQSLCIHTYKVGPPICDDLVCAWLVFLPDKGTGKFLRSRQFKTTKFVNSESVTEALAARLRRSVFLLGTT